MTTNSPAFLDVPYPRISVSSDKQVRTLLACPDGGPLTSRFSHFMLMQSTSFYITPLLPAWRLCLLPWTYNPLPLPTKLIHLSTRTVTTRRFSQPAQHLVPLARSDQRVAIMPFTARLVKQPYLRSTDASNQPSHSSMCSSR